MDKTQPEKYLYVKQCAQRLDFSLNWFKDFADLIESGWHKKFEWLGETFEFETLNSFIAHDRGLKSDPLAVYLAVKACAKNSQFSPYAPNLMELFELEGFNPELEQSKKNPLKHPSPGTGRGNKTDDNINRFNKGGTSKDYLSRRMARDFPEALDKIGKGKEFPTIRQAAISVGIIKDRVMIALPSEPETLAKNLQSKCDSDYLVEMGKSLGFIAVEGQSGGDISSDLYVKLNDQQLRELYTNLCDYLGNEF